MPTHPKIHKVLAEFKAKTLRSSSGELVTDRKQAIAIALSEARSEGARIPKKGAHLKRLKKKRPQLTRETHA